MTEDVKEADQAGMIHKEIRSEGVDDTVLQVFYTKLVKWCVVDQIRLVYWLILGFPKGSCEPIKGPIACPFSYLYFSPRTPVERPFTINYSKKLRSPESSIFSPLFLTSCKMQNFSFLLKQRHCWTLITFVRSQICVDRRKVAGVVVNILRNY